MSWRSRSAQAGAARGVATSMIVSRLVDLLTVVSLLGRPVYRERAGRRRPGGGTSPARGLLEVSRVERPGAIGPSLDGRTVVALSHLLPREDQREALVLALGDLVGQLGATPGCVGAQVCLAAD